MVQVRFGLRLVLAAAVVSSAGLAQSAPPTAASPSTSSPRSTSTDSTRSAAAAAPAATTASTSSDRLAFAPCDRKPSSNDVAAAKGAFQAGWVSFDEGDYPRAITYWEDAFRRDCTATLLLLNLARAYELGGTPDKAVTALQTYLEREPGSPDRPSIERRIEVLREKRPEAQPSQPTVVAEPPPVSSGTSAKDAATQIVAPPPAEAPASRSIVPLVVSGLGFVAFAVGGPMYLDAKGEVDDYENLCPEVQGRRVCPDPTGGTETAADRASMRMGVTGGVALAGAAVTVGGLAWYFLSEPKPNPTGGSPARRSVALSPVAGPGFASLAVRGSF